MCTDLFNDLYFVFKHWIFDKFSTLNSLYHFPLTEVDAGAPPQFLVLLTVATEMPNPAAFHPPSTSNVCHLI